MRRRDITPERERELAEQQRLLRAWKKFHREEREAALAGPHGPMVERLTYILESLELNSAPLLLAYVRGVDWQTVDYSTRLTVLHEVNTAVTKLREHNGLSPFDDGMPGDRPSVFQTIRGIVTGYKGD
jgi:hypothetical protein